MVFTSYFNVNVDGGKSEQTVAQHCRTPQVIWVEVKLISNQNNID